MFRVSHGTSRYNLNRYSYSKQGHQKDQPSTLSLSVVLGHEYPYAIKMKNIKPIGNPTTAEGDDHPAHSYSHPLHSSTASLNNISMTSHDFELKKRDLFNFDHQSKKLRFFHKRKTKDLLSKLPVQASFNDESHSSASTTPLRSKSTSQFFGQTLEQLMKNNDQQLPSVIQVTNSEGFSLALILTCLFVATNGNSLPEGTGNHRDLP